MLSIVIMQCYDVSLCVYPLLDILGILYYIARHVEKDRIVRLGIYEDNIETNLPMDVAHILGEPRISGVLFFFWLFLTISC